jgi:hypothetical protein
MTDPDGDTAGLMKSVGITTIARLDNKDDIKQKMMLFINNIKNNAIEVASDTNIMNFSRRMQAGELAGVLDGIA